MGITNVQEIIRDITAMVHGGDGVEGLSADMCIRKWTSVDPEKVEEAVDYLRKYTSALNETVASLSVRDLKIDKTTLGGLWRGGKVSRKREDNGNYTIFQELHKGFLTTLLRPFVFQITTGTEDPGLSGLRFYDAGFDVNGENVYYGENEVYAYWYYAAIESWVVSNRFDVGATPTDYFIKRALTITVSGAGILAANGVYDYIGIVTGATRWLMAGVDEYYIGKPAVNQSWLIDIPGLANVRYGVTPGTENEHPPTDPADWLNEEDDPILKGAAPSPTLTPSVGDDDLEGVGDWTGSCTMVAISSTELDFTEFIVEDGHLWISRSQQTVLKLPNVDPGSEEDIRLELRDQETFTDMAIKFETLDGVRYYLDSSPVSEEDGSMSILLTLIKNRGTEAQVRAVVGDRITVTTAVLNDKTDKELNAWLSSSICTNDGRILRT